MVLLAKKTLVSAAIEGTEGTAETGLDQTQATFVAEDVTYSIEPVRISRNVIGPSLAGKPSRVGNKLVRVSFRVEIKGSGTADTPPAWNHLISACGFSSTVAAATSVTYDPVTPSDETYWNGVGDSSGNSALTIWVFKDGKAYKAENCRGNFSIVGEAGQLAYFQFEFRGVYAAPVDVAYPGLGTQDSTTPPLVENASLTIHDLSAGDAIANTFTLNMGVSVVPRSDVSSSLGFKGFLINDRKPTIALDPEDDLIANWAAADALTRLMAGTVGTFSMAIGTAAGNTLTISAPAQKVQIEEWSEAPREEIAANAITIAFHEAEVEVAGTPEIRMVHT